MLEQSKLKVFLCHASQDKPIVRDLYQRLSAEGWIDPWLDEENILAGQEWEYEIEKAVESADVVIVLLSSVSVNKEGYIQKEIRYALDIALEKPEGTIFIIPLRLDNCAVPRKIKHWQYVDYFPAERLDWAYKKILDSLQVRARNRGVDINTLKLAEFKSTQSKVWQVKEPLPELGDRTPHTFVDNRDVDGNWHIYGASCRGKLHETEAAFREDAFKIGVAAGWVLVAVADGTSSHYLSRVGSNLAVKTAIKTMADAVTNNPPVEDTVHTALQKALREAWGALFRESELRKVEFQDLSTTLLLLIYHPRKELVGIAQIGDGLIAAQLEDGRITLLGNLEQDKYSGKAYFLTDYRPDDLPSKCEIPAPLGSIRYFLVMTDGISDDFYPPQSAKGLPLLIQHLPNAIQQLHFSKAFLELINYDHPRSSGDRTLVVVCNRAILNPVFHINLE